MRPATLVAQEQPGPGPGQLAARPARRWPAWPWWPAGGWPSRHRRVGLLKAVGGTPALAAAVLLAEHLVVALAAAGGRAGRRLAGRPAAHQPGQLPGRQRRRARAHAGHRVLLVAAAALARGGRGHARPGPAGGPHQHRRRAGRRRPARRGAGRLIRVSARLPVPLLLGLRLIARRPRRVLLSAASFTVTATTIVAVLIFHATVSHGHQRAGPSAGPPDPGNARVSEVLLVVTVVMTVLAAANAIFTTWATVLDTRRFSAVARALGATPTADRRSAGHAQLLPALAGALLGIPAGTALYSAVQNGGPQGTPPAWWLVAAVAGMLLGVAGLTAVPARIEARRPVAQALEMES